MCKNIYEEWELINIWNFFFFILGSMLFFFENNILFFKIVVLILNFGIFVVISMLKEKIRVEKCIFLDFLIYRKYDLFYYLKKGWCCMCFLYDYNWFNGKGFLKY